MISLANSSGSSQVISLPQGGGALHGIGEKFAPDLHTGTGNFTVPIALPPGRNGFQPQLNLVYSTGNGNGQFGLGWALSVPGVTRKTSHGIPRYDDRDTFLLAGAEDLVPVSTPTSGVVRHRPRTEGLFARIDHHRAARDDHWEVRGRDGLVSVYGLPNRDGEDAPVVADPSDASRIFAWKLTRTSDPFGNRIDYRYVRDAKRMDGPHRWDQVYLAEVGYVDHGDDPDEPSFLVTARFVYEDRPDPFSDYRAGFEIRTLRRCARIEVVSQEPPDTLIRTYRLGYRDQLLEQAGPSNGASLLSRVEVVGHNGDATEVLPPLTMDYTDFEPEGRTFFPLQGHSLPVRSLAAPDMELADLFGNGLPDLLEMDGSVRYWRNLGDGRFDLPRVMLNAPAGVSMADPNVQLLDADGDGRVDLLTHREGLSGYFPLRFTGEWDRRSFQRHRHAPSFSFADPEVRLVDLDGDGVTDALRSGARFECFFSDPEQGWNRTRRVERRDLDEFPDVSFSDPRVRLIDLTGDGLQDVVLVHDGNIEYWPNLGHGDWGARIHMRDSPRFPFGYDPGRVLLGDVDGDGLSDVIYVDNRKVTVWINQSGNGWSAPIEIDGTPPPSYATDIRLVDALGTGITGVLWSTDANGSSPGRLFFLDFTGGAKPYLLGHIDNHMGAVIQVEYTPSTRLYLEDQQRAQTQWKTVLPFPVQVVTRVAVIDQLSGGKLVTRYRYHHGHWDGAEREFRGFGMVEQLDTETFAAYHRPAIHDVVTIAPVEERQFSPPLLTKTWFHLGPVGDERGDWQEQDWSDEYWPDDPPQLGLVESIDAVLNTFPERRVRRDALRALRGSILRTELYALDASDREERPYTVKEFAYGVHEISPPAIADGGRRRIFFPHLVAERATQWERGVEPLSRFTFTDDYDRFGLPRRVISLAAPRSAGAPYLGTRTVTTYGQRDDARRYIADRIVSTTTSEIIDDGGSSLIELRDAAREGTAQVETIKQTFNYFDGDAFVGLPLGQVGEFGALVRSESLVLTESIMRAAYRGDDSTDASQGPPYLVPDGSGVWTADYPARFRDLLPTLAGYVFEDGGGEDERGFFVQTDRRQYDFHDPQVGRHRGMLTVARDPLGRDNRVIQDVFDLLPVEAVDSAGLRMRATNDYRVFQPGLVTDLNDNRTSFTFTPLGFLETRAVMGRSGELVGDSPETPGTRLIYELLPSASQGNVSHGVSIRTVRRVHHVNDGDVPPADRDETIETVEYSDGFGRLIQTRSQAEQLTFGDGVFGGGTLPVRQGDPATANAIVGAANGDRLRPNVIVSGWQVYDNKGRVVERFEPTLATGWEYQRPSEAQLGQRMTMFYDPRGQVVRTLAPDGSEERVIYGVPVNLADPERFEPTPWEVYSYDANDNGGRTKPNEAAAYEHHWDTPGSVVFDALERTVVCVERHRGSRSTDTDPLPPVEEIRTVSRYDIRGNVLQITDALDRVALSYVYDLANRPLRIESIDAGVRRTVVDAAGRDIEHRDSKGALVLQAYDLLGRPSRLWARDSSNSLVTLRDEVAYGDDGDPDQPAGIRAARRTSNQLGKLLVHHDEAGVLNLAAYDFKGNVLERVRTVISDEAVLRVFPAPGNPAPDWQVRSFRVDWEPPDGSSLGQVEADLLDPNPYESSARYDALNRVVLALYPRDVEGQRKELRASYDRAGALKRVRLGTNTIVEHVAYDAKGQRTFVALGNGVMIRYAYDPRTFRLVRLRSERYVKSPTDPTYQPTGPPLQDLAYQHDLVGNVLGVVERTPGSGVRGNPQALDVDDPELRALVLSGDALVRRFAYDPRYRLVSATGRQCRSGSGSDPWLDGARCGFNSPNHATPNQDNAPDLTTDYNETYEYDLVGNLLRLRHQAGSATIVQRTTLAPGSNRLAARLAGDVSFAYDFDRNGNMVDEARSRHFEWDQSDRMKVFRTQVGASEPSTFVHYLYDAAGQRIKKVVRNQGSGFASTTCIDGVFEHHRSRSHGPNAGGHNHVHVMDGQQRVALIRIGTPHPDDHGPAFQHHLGDHLGSSNVVLSDDGSFVNREEQTPFGEVTFGGFARKRYRFTGKERDEESGLYYHGARYYAPWLARWASCDPRAPIPVGSLYTYASNNPMRLVDPNGRDDTEPRFNASVGLTLSWGTLEKNVGAYVSMTGQLPLGNAGAEGGARLDVALFTERMGVSETGGVGAVSYFGGLSVGEWNSSAAKLVQVNHPTLRHHGSGMVTNDQRLTIGWGRTDFFDLRISTPSGILSAGGLKGHSLNQGVGHFYLRGDKDDLSARLTIGNDTTSPMGGSGTDWFETMNGTISVSEAMAGGTREFLLSLRAFTDPIVLKDGQRQGSGPQPGAPRGRYFTYPVGSNGFPLTLTVSELGSGGALTSLTLGYSFPAIQGIQDWIHDLIGAKYFSRVAVRDSVMQIDLAGVSQSSTNK